MFGWGEVVRGREWGGRMRAKARDGKRLGLARSASAGIWFDGATKEDGIH